MKTKLLNALPLAVIAAMLVTSLALADNLQNDVVAGGNDTFTAPGSTTITYRLIGNSSPSGDIGGCNVDLSNPATLNITLPAGVTPSSTSVQFTACGSVGAQSVTYSSSTPGNYAISHSISGGKPGSLYNNQANFTLHVLAPPPPADTSAPTASPTQSPAANANGWNNSDVTVTWNWTDDAGGSGIDAGNCTLSSTSSGEGNPITLTASCKDLAGNTGSASYDVKVDKTAPTFGSCPAGGPFLLGSGTHSVGPISVDAAISGLNAGASTLSGSVDANSIGLKTVNFTAVDNADNSAGKSCSYSVIYNFSGFFQPVENPGPGPNYVFNRVKAGSAIPVKFSLSGDQGLGIMQMGYPKSENVSCTNSSSVDDLTETVTAGNSSLSYDPTIDQYNYVWKTDKAWATKCRKLTVRLIDGTDHVAYFMFTK